MGGIKKIVIIGPESTGKSTLCASLATHYGTSWCPEFAREFLTENGTNYTYDQLLTIAKGQLIKEEAYLQKANKMLIIDTDMYVMKVWCEFVFNNCHPFILEKIVERKYDAYLLCDIDLDWMPDGMREYPNEATRKALFTTYKELLINQQTPWGIVKGKGAERTQNAIALIEKLLN
jgi:hypothetical protein